MKGQRQHSLVNLNREVHKLSLVEVQAVDLKAEVADPGAEAAGPKAADPYQPNKDQSQLRARVFQIKLKTDVHQINDHKHSWMQIQLINFNTAKTSTFSQITEIRVATI